MHKLLRPRRLCFYMTGIRSRSENAYHSRQFRVHPGNPRFMVHVRASESRARVRMCKSEALGSEASRHDRHYKGAE